MKKVILSVIALTATAVTLALIWSCSETTTEPEMKLPVETPDLVLLDKLSVSVTVGGTEEVTATARTKDGKVDSLSSVFSSDDGVVTATFIDSVVTVEGVSLGTATVTVNCKSGESKSLPVRVYDPRVLETNGIQIKFTDEYSLAWFNSSGEGIIGSFWHPVAPAGFYPLGSIAWPIEDPLPIHHFASVVVKASPGSDALAAPVDYELVWYDFGMDQAVHGSVWKPIPPNNNYVALGLVFVTGYGKPSTDVVRCVKKSLTVVGQPGMALWTTYQTEADYAFVAWKINIPAGSYNERLFLDAGTFMGHHTGDVPSPDEVTRVLAVDIPLVVDGAHTSYFPELSDYDQPPAVSTPVMAKAILVPFNAIYDPLYYDDLHWQVTNSPFYRLERTVCFKTIGHLHNSGSADAVLSQSTTFGFETTESTEWSVDTGVSITAGGGVGIGIASVNVSATVSVNLGYKTATSITNLAYEELTKTMTVPAGKSGAIWQQWNWFTLKRHHGADLEIVGAAADFGSNSWTIDDYPNE